MLSQLYQPEWMVRAVVGSVTCRCVDRMLELERIALSTAWARVLHPFSDLSPSLVLAEGYLYGQMRNEATERCFRGVRIPRIQR